MAPTASRPWPPPSTADRASRSVGERLPRLSTPCCDPVRLVLRRPLESALHAAVRVVGRPLRRVPPPPRPAPGGGRGGGRPPAAAAAAAGPSAGRRTPARPRGGRPWTSRRSRAWPDP